MSYNHTFSASYFCLFAVLSTWNNIPFCKLRARFTAHPLNLNIVACSFSLLFSLQLLLSLTTRGWGGKVTTALPPIIKATYGDSNVTVRLRESGISIRQPKSGRHKTAADWEILMLKQLSWISPMTIMLLFNGITLTGF